MKLYEEYQKLFEIYLSICRKKEPDSMESEELRYCCEVCKIFSHELMGMLILMERCGEITEDIESREEDRIREAFSTIELYDAYIEPGELMVFVDC